MAVPLPRPLNQPHPRREIQQQQQDPRAFFEAAAAAAAHLRGLTVFQRIALYALYEAFAFAWRWIGGE